MKKQTHKLLILASIVLSSSGWGQEILWQESFESDGEGSRYITEGAAIFEPEDFASEGISADQSGPVYWSRIVEGEPSFVGLPSPTPERRIVMAWDSNIAAEDVTEDFWTHFDAVVKWLLREKSNATILYSGLAGEGDFAFADRLESLGHTIEEDAGGELPNPSSIDMYVYSGGSVSRFVKYPVPGIHYASSDLDDELLSSIGTPLTLTLPEVSITAPDHSAAGGQAGQFDFVKGENTFQTFGTELPGGATIVAAFTREVLASVNDLESADALFDGSTPSLDVESTNINVADIVNPVLPSSQIAFFDWDNPIEGNPQGGFAIRATGQIEAAAGTFSLAMGGTDGSRLKIDLNKNGLGDEDTLITMDRRGAWQYSEPIDVIFSAGTYDFEWVAFNAVGEFGAELLVSLDAGGDAPAVDADTWDLISNSSQHVSLDGDLLVETFVPDLPPEQIQIPFTMALEAPDEGGLVFGGGPFGGFDGNAAFGGSALNKFSGEDGVGSPKWIIWNDPIDLSGKENVKLTLALGATFLDFETGDYFKVYIDDGDPLIWFTAPSGEDKFFNDAMTNPSNPTRLRLALQDVTYDIPAEVDSINLRIEAATTWWNEIVVFDNIRVSAGEIAPPQSVGITGFSFEDGNLVIEYSGTLKSSASVIGPYEAVAGASSPARIPIDQEAQFYLAQ